MDIVIDSILVQAQSSDGDTDAMALKVYRQKNLDKHNEYRQKHCTRELTLSDDFNDIAQDYADKLADIDELPPNYSGVRMENIFFGEKTTRLSGK